MSSYVGDRVADPCPRCHVEAVRDGRPAAAADGRPVVLYACTACGRDFSRPVEDDLGVYDIVRVELPDATVYGTVWEVAGDRIGVRVTDRADLLWTDRWQVIVS